MQVKLPEGRFNLWVQFFQKCKENCVHEMGGQMPRAWVRRDGRALPGGAYNLVGREQLVLQKPLFPFSHFLTPRTEPKTSRGTFSKSFCALEWGSLYPASKGEGQ